MGAKITIDSATLMNKGLEFIEAMRLYEMPPEKISILVHRQSIVHSLVEYTDNAVLAQLGAPDMRLPIQYALTYPARTIPVAEPLNLLTCPPLTFEEADPDTFRCLKIALNTARIPGAACAIMNGANEEAVAAFLADRIGFLDIADLVENALMQVPNVEQPTLEDILAVDAAARASVRANIR
jgi:1-deoxy-D-xylulose-5-phosphate reductoisomerase